MMQFELPIKFIPKSSKIDLFV